MPDRSLNRPNAMAQSSDFYKNVVGGLKGRNMLEMGNNIIINETLLEQGEELTGLGPENFQLWLDMMGEIKDTITDSSVERDQLLLVEDQLSVLERLAESQEDMTQEQQYLLQNLINNTRDMVDTQLTTTHSLSATLKDTLVENVGGISGVLGSLGMNNPALMFLGKYIDDVREKRRNIRDEQEGRLQKFFMDRQRNMVSDEVAGRPYVSEEQLPEVMEKFYELFNERTMQWYEELDDWDGNMSQMMDETVGILKDALYDITGQEMDINDPAISKLSDMFKIAMGEMGFEDELPKLSEITEVLGLQYQEDKARNAKDEERYQAQDEMQREQLALLEQQKAKEQAVLGPVPPQEKGGGLLDMIPGGKLLKGALGKLSPLLGAGGLGTVLSGLGTVLTSLVTVALPLWMMFDGILGLFTGWFDAANRLDKDVADITTGDKFASAISAFFENFFSIFDYIIPDNLLESIIGYPTLKEWMRESLLKPLSDMFNADSWSQVAGEVFEGMWITLTDLWKSQIEWIVDMFKGVINEIKDIFVALVGEIADSLPFGMGDKLKKMVGIDVEAENAPSAIYNPESTIVSQVSEGVDAQASGENLAKARTARSTVTALAEQNVVQQKMWGESEIKDWPAVEKLNERQIEKMIEYDDWDDKTGKRLQELLEQKRVEGTTNALPATGLTSPTAEMKQMTTGALRQETEALQQGGMQQTVVAPSMNTNVTTNNNNSSTVHMPVPTSETDRTLNRLEQSNF